MQNVATIIKYLSQISSHTLSAGSQMPEAHQSLLHYLSSFADPEQNFDEFLLEDFFAHCLDYAHWQQNKTTLSQDIEALLENFGTQHSLGLSLADIKWPHETQIMEIENHRDHCDILQCYLNTVYKGLKYRLINDEDKKMIAVILHADHSLSVQSFDRKMMVRHGQLEPLKKNLQLHYTANLELKADIAQRIELAPFVTAQFRVSGETNNIAGAILRGYLSQKIYNLESKNLNAYPKLFFAVKKLEQHFVHRQSDPYYQNIISSLERSIELIKRQDPDAIKESMDVLAQAQNAYEYVFNSDKLLSLLIKELQYTLSARRTVVRTGQESFVDPDHGSSFDASHDQSGRDEWTEINLASEKILTTKYVAAEKALAQKQMANQARNQAPAQTQNSASEILIENNFRAKNLTQQIQDKTDLLKRRAVFQKTNSEAMPDLIEIDLTNSNPNSINATTTSSINMQMSTTTTQPTSKANPTSTKPSPAQATARKAIKGFDLTN